LRRERQWTLKEAEAFCRVPYGTISRLELGKTTNITTHTLLALADLYAVSVDFLLGRSNVRQVSHPPPEHTVFFRS
jgi:transcriptional regulator with XRE-family HTH domain